MGMPLDEVSINHLPVQNNESSLCKRKPILKPWNWDNPIQVIWWKIKGWAHRKRWNCWGLGSRRAASRTLGPGSGAPTQWLGGEPGLASIGGTSGHAPSCTEPVSLFFPPNRLSFSLSFSPCLTELSCSWNDPVIAWSNGLSGFGFDSP